MNRELEQGEDGVKPVTTAGRSGEARKVLVFATLCSYAPGLVAVLDAS